MDNLWNENRNLSLANYHSIIFLTNVHARPCVYIWTDLTYKCTWNHTHLMHPCAKQPKLTEVDSHVSSNASHVVTWASEDSPHLFTLPPQAHLPTGMHIPVHKAEQKACNIPIRPLSPACWHTHIVTWAWAHTCVHVHTCIWANIYWTSTMSQTLY